MDIFFRWIEKHHKFVRACLALILGVGLGILRIKTDMSWILLIGLLLWGSILVSVVSTYPLMRFQRRALKILTEQCDPFPLLKEMQDQVSHGYAQPLDTVLRIDLAVALFNCGSEQTALDVMRLIPVETTKKLSPIHKALYYYNLAFFRMETGDFEGSEEAYRRFGEIAVGKVRKAFMKKYPEIFEMSEAEHLYRMGDYAAALEKARRIRHKSASAKVGGALFCARCAIALGDRNAARQDLNFVIENGNRLSEVDKAWKLLMNM